MNKQFKRVVRAAFIVVASFSANAAVADDGASWKQLSSEWWQWALSVPTSVNPLLDATGDDCMVGQHGSTWFLAGTVTSGPVTRSCEIPQGATLFFPVINSVGIDTPGHCGQTDPLPASVYRAANAAFVDGATQLSVTLDGRPVGPLHRTVSPVFAAALPADSLFLGVCGGDLPAGVYSTVVDDGFYARVDRLRVGKHTLHIHAEQPAASFAVDVTYDLNVVPDASR